VSRKHKRSLEGKGQDDQLKAVEEAHSSVSADDSIILTTPTTLLDYTSGENQTQKMKITKKLILEEEFEVSPAEQISTKIG